MDTSGFARKFTRKSGVLTSYEDIGRWDETRYGDGRESSSYGYWNWCVDVYRLLPPSVPTSLLFSSLLLLSVARLPPPLHERQISRVNLSTSFPVKSYLAFPQKKKYSNAINRPNNPKRRSVENFHRDIDSSPLFVRFLEFLRSSTKWKLKTILQLNRIFLDKSASPDGFDLLLPIRSLSREIEHYHSITWKLCPLSKYLKISLETWNP